MEHTGKDCKHSEWKMRKQCWNTRQCVTIGRAAILLTRLPLGGGSGLKNIH